jgi:hypothetical protein
MKAILAMIVLLIACSTGANASEIVFQPFTCPIDSTKFEARVQIGSFTAGQMLDWQAFGAIFSPEPLPVCPTDHFVIYADKIPADDMARLRSYVPSAAYQELAADNSSYFLLAKLMEQLGAPPRTLGYLYLQASWEVAEDPARHQAYIEKSLPGFIDGLPESAGDIDDSLGVEILCAELQRQMGLFSQAGERLEQVLSDRRLTEFLTRIAKYEVSLVALRDSLRHEIPQETYQ